MALSSAERQRRFRVKRDLQDARRGMPHARENTQTTVRARVRQGLGAFAGLPSAAEVAHYFERDGVARDEALLVAERIDAAAAWVAAFARAFRKPE